MLVSISEETLKLLNHLAQRALKKIPRYRPERMLAAVYNAVTDIRLGTSGIDHGLGFVRPSQHVWVAGYLHSVDGHPIPPLRLERYSILPFDPYRLTDEEYMKNVRKFLRDESIYILPQSFHRALLPSLTWPLGHLTEKEIEEVMRKELSFFDIRKHTGVSSVRELSSLQTLTTLRSTMIRGGSFMGFVSCSNTLLPCYNFYAGYTSHLSHEGTLLPAHSLLLFKDEVSKEIAGWYAKKVFSGMLKIEPHFHIEGCLRIGKDGPCFYDGNAEIRGAEHLPLENYTTYSETEPEYFLGVKKDRASHIVGISKGGHLSSLVFPAASGKTLLVLPPSSYFHYSSLSNTYQWFLPRRAYVREVEVGGWRVFPDPNSWYYSPSKKAFVNERTGEVVPYTRALFDLMEEAKPGKTYDRPLVGFVAGLNPKEKEVQVILHPFSQGLWENFPLVRGMKVNAWPDNVEKQWELIQKALDEGYHYIYSEEGKKRSIHWSRGTLTLPTLPRVMYSIGEQSTVKMPTLHLGVETPRKMGRSEWYDVAWRLPRGRG